MAPSTEASAPKLPATADFNNFFNKVSLANAKKTTLLSNMRAKHSLNRPAAVASFTPAQNGTFSALTNPTTTTTTTSSQPPPRRTTTADDQDMRFADPKLGIGFAPSQSEEQTSAATRELGRRLLGGRRTDPKTAEAQKRRAQDDDSEEEEGRSGLGRKKKRTRVDDDAEAEQHKDEAPDTAVEVPEVVAEDATVSQDGASLPNDAKRKKKKKNKKKKAAEGGEV
ncbi:hypothetical protein C8035_v005252 [Colletotrichum spinosum]|uniref:Uncharacterized protein n=1 Tax=Colletotrichum spinosum TaxID=1347390 RepID=A0A4R8Q2N8_9PEZI|nr:hypothetical protein C8035_v005252 [Colletotrichum spinosum]